jgi:hypothetical protein
LFSAQDIIKIMGFGREVVDQAGVPTPAKVPAGASRDTLAVLICVSLEYLVPAKSPAKRGQSASVNGLTPFCLAMT